MTNASFVRTRFLPAALILLASTGFGASHAQEDWVRTAGPQEPIVSQIVPGAGDEVFLNATGDVYRSSDGGATWASLNFDPVGTDIAYGGGWLYASGRTGFETFDASSDGGQTFVNRDGEGDTALDDSVGQVWASDTHVYSIDENNFAPLRRAAHGSSEWENVNGDLPDGFFEGRPADVDDVYASGDTICVALGSSQSEGNLVYRSTDGGVTYTQATGPIDQFFTKQFIVEPGGANIYLRDRLGLLRSTDQCASFNRVTGSEDFDTQFLIERALDIVVKANGTLVLAEAGFQTTALFTSNDNGATFTASALPNANDSRQVLFGTLGALGNTLLAGATGGLFREVSGALTESDTGIASSSVSQLLAGNNAGEILAATSSGIAVTNDAGATWTDRASGLLAPPIDIERIGDDLYARTGIRAAGRSVQKSTDGGVTWAAVGDSLPGFDGVLNTDLVVMGNRLFMIGRANFQNVIYTSTDGGDTWTQATATGFTGLSRNAVAHKGALFISEGTQTIRSTDFAESFEVVGQSQGDAQTQLNVAGVLFSTPNAIYSSLTEGSSRLDNDIYVSYDSGESWGRRTDLIAQGLAADADGNLYGRLTRGDAPAFLAADSNAWEVFEGGLLGCSDSRDSTVHPSNFYVTETQVFGGMDQSSSCAPAGVWVADRRQVPAGDRQPEPFIFDDGFNTAFEFTESNAVTITGIDQPAPIDFAGGVSGSGYSIGCNGSFTDDPGMIENGQTVCVGHFTGFQDGEVRVVTLRVGGYAAPWKLTTGEPQEDGEPNPFTFPQANDVTANSIVTSETITISGFNVAVEMSVMGGEFSIGCAPDGFTTTPKDVNSGVRVCVRHTSSDTAGASTITTLTVGTESGDFRSVVSNQSNNDTTPDPFTFVDQTDVATDTVITSNTIRVEGTNNNAPISITGGSYSVDCNASNFTDQATTVAPGTELCVRHTSASTPGTATDTTLTIGGVSDTFTSTTAGGTGGPDTIPEPFSFTDQSEVAINTVIVSDTVTVAGIDSPTTISVTGGEYSIGCTTGTFTAAAGSINNGDTVCVRHTSAAEGDAVTDTTLTIGTVSDTFTTTTASEDGNPVGDTETVADPSGGTTTIAVTDGNLENLSNSPNPPAGTNPPAGVSFPNGVFAFDVTGLTPGQTVDVVITLPTNAGPDTYYKFQNGGSFEFLRGPGDTEGATISGNVITLRLTDGGVGDADGLANGTIVDPGAPGVTAVAPGGGEGGPAATVSRSGSLSAGLLCWLLLATGFRRRLRRST